MENGMTCPGCGRTFEGQRGLRAHQSVRFTASGCLPMRPTDPKDDQLRKYHEARLWIKEPNFLSGLAHDFAKFYAESDWDDPNAAWAEFRQAINSGSRSAVTVQPS